MTNNNDRRAAAAIALVVEGLRARREKAHRLRLRAMAGDTAALEELSELYWVSVVGAMRVMSPAMKEAVGRVLDAAREAPSHDIGGVAAAACAAYAEEPPPAACAADEVGAEVFHCARRTDAGIYGRYWVICAASRAAEASLPIFYG